jgi:hypothetical protein
MSDGERRKEKGVVYAVRQGLATEPTTARTGS